MGIVSLEIDPLEVAKLLFESRTLVGKSFEILINFKSHEVKLVARSNNFIKK